MDPNISPNVRKNIRNFLMVLFSAVVFGLLISLFFVIYYSPLEKYRAKDTLISPKTAASLKLNLPIDAKQTATFSFSGISFTYKENNSQKDVTLPVKLEDYHKFYDSLNHDLSETDKETREIPFQNGLSASIDIKVNDPFSNHEKVLQHIEIGKFGDHYRVQLFQDNKQEPWAYFYHPGVLQEAKSLFIQSGSQ